MNRALLGLATEPPEAATVPPRRTCPEDNERGLEVPRWT